MESSLVNCVLSDADIIYNLDKGNIVIDPFDVDSLGNCSYDVKLGKFYYKQNQQVFILNPWNVAQSRLYWDGPFIANVAIEETKEKLGLELGEEYIILQPKETILAHTQEFIGGRSKITTMMKSRSSLMRNTVSCCLCAGWGDIGYTNRWTMEITNHSLKASVVLPVGKRVAQIIFFYTGQPSHSYTSGGKYQTEDDLQMIKETWSPNMMLPKLYNEK